MRLVSAVGLWTAALFFVFTITNVQNSIAETESDDERWPVVEDIFESALCAGCANIQKDGASNVGVLFEAVGGTIVENGHSLLLCDNGGGGSSVRIVNRSGIFTIAGSHTSRGNEDGPVAAARFSLPQSVVSVSGVIYVADTFNNVIRSISAGVVSTFLSDKLTTPKYIAPFFRGSGLYDLFISDTAGSRIAFLTLSKEPVLTNLVTNVQPNQLQLSVKSMKLYAFSNMNNIRVVMLSQNSIPSQEMWNLGNFSCMGYISSLMLMEEENQLYYYGKLDGKTGILALFTNKSIEESQKECPIMIKELEFNDVQSLVKINKHGFYVVRTTSVHIVHDKEFVPTPTPIPFEVGTAVAAFPTTSLPESDAELIHKFYMLMMKDVATAFSTTDYIALFGRDGKIDVPGNVNVSTWRNLTTMLSSDSTIAITKYQIKGVDSKKMQNLLFSSSWTSTRSFLNSLKKEKAWEKLNEFCMIDCVNNCAKLSYKKDICYPFTSLPLCDDACIAGITSSIVFGTVGILLVWLLITNSANILNALLLLPPV